MQRFLESLAGLLKQESCIVLEVALADPLHDTVVSIPHRVVETLLYPVIYSGFQIGLIFFGHLQSHFDLDLQVALLDQRVHIDVSHDRRALLKHLNAVLQR